jgi:hypothetical protein
MRWVGCVVIVICNPRIGTNPAFSANFHALCGSNVYVRCNSSSIADPNADNVRRREVRFKSSASADEHTVADLDRASTDDE